MPFKSYTDILKSNRQAYRRKILKKLGEASWDEHICNVKTRKAERLKNLPEYNRKKQEELQNDPIRLEKKRKKSREYYWKIAENK